MSEKPKVTIQSPEVSRSPDLEYVREEDDVPMHHQVLYALLGEDKAESILNPKIVEPARRQSIHPDAKAIMLLRHASVDTGMGAEALWGVLKDRSDKRIHKLETNIPDDWKKAYGAFLRDRLSQKKPLLFRSFTGEEDVPNLDLLKKDDYIYKVRKMRNHTNVMYRTADNNSNRTTLLLNSNPLPRSEKEDVTLARYFEEKFLKLADPQESFLRLTEHGNKQSSDPKQLHFLTNEGAKCKGTFYAKYADMETMKMVTDIPGYKTRLPPSMVARYSLSPPVNRPSFSKEWRKHENRSQNEVRVTKKPTTWEPLTFGTLMEYAPTKPTLGSGDFNHGKVTYWRNASSTETSI